MKKSFFKILILLGVCVSPSVYAQDVEYLPPYVFKEVVIDDSDVEYLPPYVFKEVVIDDSNVEYLDPYVFEGGVSPTVSSPNALERSLNTLSEGIGKIRFPKF